MLREKKFHLYVFVSYVILLRLVIWFSGYNGLYGQDSHEYFRYSKGLAAYFITGSDPGTFFWPVIYPLIGAIGTLLTGSTLVLQWISVLSAAWIMMLLCSFLLNEFPGREKEISIYSFIFLGASPYFFRYAVSDMSDIFAIAAMSTAYYCTYKFNHKPKAKYLVIVCATAAIAVFSRMALLPLVILPVGFTFYLAMKRKMFIGILLSVLLMLIPIGIHFYFKKSAAGDIFSHYLVAQWSVHNFFATSFTTIDGTTQYATPNIVDVLNFIFHPGYIFAGLFFLVLIFSKKSQPRLIYTIVLLGMVMYCVLIAGLPFRNSRFLVALLPFTLVIYFPSFLTFCSWFHYRNLMGNFIIFILVGIQLILAWRAFMPFWKYNRQEQRLAAVVNSYHPEILYTFSVDGALRNYDYKGEIINLWNEKIYEIHKGAFLLFNKKEFEKQWDGKNPMINYNYLINFGEPVVVRKFDDGWELYEIKKEYRSANTGVPERSS